MTMNKDYEWRALARALCFKDEEHMYRTMYEEENLSLTEISQRLHTSAATIGKRMDKFGIRKRGKGGAQGWPTKKFALFHMDQRVVLSMSQIALCNLLEVSHSVVYHYTKWKVGYDALGFAMNSRGTADSRRRA